MNRKSDRLKSARERELRSLLEAQRARVAEAAQSRMREVREEGADEGHVVLDIGEMSEADIQGDLGFAVLGLYGKTLAAIDEALDQLDEGTHGDCLECHEPIAAERLQALPFAVRCTRCEGAYEASGHDGPDFGASLPRRSVKYLVNAPRRTGAMSGRMPA